MSTAPRRSSTGRNARVTTRQLKYTFFPALVQEKPLAIFCPRFSLQSVRVLQHLISRVFSKVSLDLDVRVIKVVEVSAPCIPQFFVASPTTGKDVGVQHEHALCNEP